MEKVDIFFIPIRLHHVPFYYILHGETGCFPVGYFPRGVGGKNWPPLLRTMKIFFMGEFYAEEGEIV